MNDQVKMVIVMRDKFPDGKGGTMSPRKGKIAAQASHAASAFLVEKINGIWKRLKLALNVLINGSVWTPIEWEWLQTGTTKICVRVESEEELLTVAEQAKKASIEVHIVTDEGRTEFGGIPTKTCLALGPDLASKIDPISGHLKLL